MIQIIINNRVFKLGNKYIFYGMCYFTLFLLAWLITTVSNTIDVTGVHKLLFVVLSLTATFFFWLPNMFPEVFG